MGFFDGVPSFDPAPDPGVPVRPGWMRPEDRIGGAVATQLLVARSGSAALGLTGVAAFPNGFEFTIVVVLREEDRRGRVFEYGFQRFDEPPGPEFLRIGLGFADGSVVTNLDRHPWNLWERELAGPVLIGQDGGGGGRRYEMRYWVAPLPPEGAITVVAEWPAQGISETRADLDGSLIRAAADRAVSLW